jgi:hypothetical protein
VFVRYPPGKIRYDGDWPVALVGVRVAPSFRTVELPLGLPTTSARTSRGAWALYPIGAEVVVVHPDGAISGPLPVSQPRSVAWRPATARVTWTGRRPGRSSAC